MIYPDDGTPRAITITGNKLTYNAKELSSVLGISLGSCYKVMKRPDFPCITVGKRLLVSKKALEVWLSCNSNIICH